MVLDRQPPIGTEGESWRTADKVAAFQGVPQTIWVRMETGRAARGRERLTGSMLAFVFSSWADPENWMDALGEAADGSWLESGRSGNQQLESPSPGSSGGECPRGAPSRCTTGNNWLAASRWAWRLAEQRLAEATVAFWDSMEF